MSFELKRHRRRSAEDAGPRWTGVAFIVEAMLLLVFLIGSLAVFTQLFAGAVDRASQSRSLTAAVALASNSAERFCADPLAEAGETVSGDMRVICDVTGDRQGAGTLYHATISVYEDGSPDPLYVIQTARYQSGVS